MKEIIEIKEILKDILDEEKSFNESSFTDESYNNIVSKLDYIEEAISDDIDKKIKELESKVEIKGYQKDIKALQEENEKLKNSLNILQGDLEVYMNLIEKKWEGN